VFIIIRSAGSVAHVRIRNVFRQSAETKCFSFCQFNS